MNTTFTVQAAALALAAVVTFSLLGSVGSVANKQYDNAVLAQSANDTIPTQQVVIVAKRLPRV